MLNLTRILVAMCVALFPWMLANSQEGTTEPFLSLPYLDDDIYLIQGPLYHPDISNGRHSSFFRERGFPFDFASDTSSANWKGFEVASAAPGRAMQTCSGPNFSEQLTAYEQEVRDGLQANSPLIDLCSVGYGRLVIVWHDVQIDGKHVFTLYSHFDEIASDIPFKTRADTDFGSWKRVERGEFLGIAGNTGLTSCTGSQCAHLHFEVFVSENGYVSSADGIDPFDISSASNRLDRDGYYSNYRDRSSFTDCGENSIWLECPPEYVAPPIPGSPQFVSFIQGDPGIPGDGKTVTISGLVYTLDRPYPLAGVTDGITITAYNDPIPSAPFTVWMGKDPIDERCNPGRGGSSAYPSSIAPIYNGVPGYARYIPQDQLQLLLDSLNANTECEGKPFTFDNVYITRAYPVGRDTLDAMAIGFGRNAWPVEPRGELTDFSGATISFTGVVTGNNTLQFVDDSFDPIIVENLRQVEPGDTITGTIRYSVDRIVEQGFSATGPDFFYDTTDAGSFRFGENPIGYGVTLQLGGYDWNMHSNFDVFIGDNAPSGLSFADYFWIRPNTSGGNSDSVSFPVISEDNIIVMTLSQRIEDPATPPTLVNTNDLPTRDGDFLFQEGLMNQINSNAPMEPVKLFGTVEAYPDVSFDFEVDPANMVFQPATTE